MSDVDCGKRRRVDKGGRVGAADVAAHQQRVNDVSAREAPAAAAGAVAAAVEGAVAGGLSEAGTCFICLGDVPPPIQSGCACRGDAGLAHMGCRALAAAHCADNRDEADEGWWKCGTCGQGFTGVMQVGLAEAWWSKVQNLSEEDSTRLAASECLAKALKDHGKLAEAEKICRAILAVERRVRGPEHPETLSTANNLAVTLKAQGKFTEAEAMYREVLSVERRVLGPEHPRTLGMAENLANALGGQGKYAEAERMHREVLAVRQRVLGAEHPDTLVTKNNLACALDDQGKFTEAEAMYREVLAVERRVLGPDHPNTLVTAGNLAACIRSARGKANPTKK
jgi:Flp pilus assembly protein TadD